MPKIRVAKAFDYVPKSKVMQSMVHYPKGFEGDVPDAHASAMIDAGHAEEVSGKPAAAEGAGKK